MKAITIIGAMAMMAATDMATIRRRGRSSARQKDRQGLPVGGRQQQREQELVPDEAQGDQRGGASPGSAMGTTIWKKILSLGTLSTSAASSISTGSASKKSRISQTTIGSEKAV